MLIPLSGFRTAALIMLLALSAGLLTAQEAKPSASSPAAPEKKCYTTVRANGRIPVIDGRLDDEAWARCAWEDGFIQSEPYEGRRALGEDRLQDPLRRQVHLCRRPGLRLPARRRSSGGCPGATRRTATRSAWPSTASIDHLTAFVFAVNAAGVKSDQLMVNDGQSSGNEEDMSWDPIWDVATAVDDEGWTAEMRIPLSQIRFGDQDEQVWGLQVRRALFRNNETSDWQLIPRNASGIVHLFGELRGLVGLDRAPPDRDHALHGRQPPVLPARPRQSLRHGRQADPRWAAWTARSA